MRGTSPLSHYPVSTRTAKTNKNEGNLAVITIHPTSSCILLALTATFDVMKND